MVSQQLQVALLHATSVDRVLVHRAGGEEGKAPSRHVGTIYTSPKLRNGLGVHSLWAQYTADLINGPAYRLRRESRPSTPLRVQRDTFLRVRIQQEEVGADKEVVEWRRQARPPVFKNFP